MTRQPISFSEGNGMGRPHLVGVGFQKCGTSSVARFLKDSGLRVPRGRKGSKRKELHWFGWTGRLRSVETLSYRFVFGKGGLSGEYTPNYAEHPVSLHSLSRSAPEVKVIVFVRNPVDRFISAIEHARTLGKVPSHWTGEKIFDTAWKGEGDGWIARALRRGTYVQDIRTVFSLFGENRVFVGYFEEWVNPDISGHIESSLLDFSGLATPGEGLPEVLQINDSRSKLLGAGLQRVEWNESVKSRLADYYSPYKRPLEALLGKITW